MNYLGRLFLTLALAIPLVVSAQYDRGGSGPLIYKVFFDTSDFNLDERDHKVLGEMVAMIKKQPGLLFEVSGHTDTSGTEAYNQNLSLKRANEVKAFLLTQGVSEKNLYVVGKGESVPFKHRGKYSDKFSRRVEFRQILRVAGELKDVKTGRPVRGKVLLNIPNNPMKNQELLTDARGKFEFITVFRKKYYFFAFADGYLSATDSIMASMKEPGASNIEMNLALTSASIKERINFENIYFFPTQFKVMPKSEPSIQKIVDLLNNNPTIYLEIRGHVSQPDRDNLPENIIEDGYKLSFARAEAVYNELMRKGISPSRIKYRGMGSDEMVYPSPQTDVEEEANRRVEVVILNLK